MRTESSTSLPPSSASVDPDRYLKLFEELHPLVGSQCVDEVARAAVDLIASVLEVEACSLFLHDAGRGTLQLQAATHIPKSDWTVVRLPLEEGLCGGVYRSGQSELLSSAEEFSRHGLDPSPRYGPPSCVVTPLRIEGRVEGVLNVAHPRQARPFNEHDLRLIEAAAGLISAGIQNAVQFAETVSIHEHLEGIFDSLHVGIVALDKDLRMTHTNQRFDELLGAPGRLLRGKLLTEALGSRLTGVCHRLADAAGQGAAAPQERLHATLGGREMALSITASRVSCGGAQFSDRLLMFEDTGQEEELERLREADQVKGAFLRMISHELRTPITVIQGAMPLLRKCRSEFRGDSAVLLERVEGLLAGNARKLSGIINAILDCIEIEEGSLSLLIDAADLNGLVRSAHQEAVARAGEKKIQWEIHLEEDLSPVAADANRCQQCVYELLENAVKFSPPESTIRVRTFVDGGYGIVRVANEGEQICDEERSEIFEKFYQIDKRTTRQIGGCGLGLYLIKNLALLHGGSVNLAEGGEKETVFEFRLPLSGLTGAMT